MQNNGNRQTQPEPLPAPAHGIVFALAAIAVGALFFLNNLGIAGFHDLARFWPVVAIALGFVLLVDSRTAPASASGGLIVAAASFFLLGNLGILHLEWRVLWPALPIAFGVLSLLRAEPGRDHRPVLHR
jgi:Domain of unknown function (DUF5668)